MPSNGEHGGRCCLKKMAANCLNEIYVDNAATTPVDEEVLNLMIELQRKYFANP